MFTEEEEGLSQIKAAASTFTILIVPIALIPPVETDGADPVETTFLA